MRIAKIVIVLFIVAAQLLAFEAFERFYYRFEFRYTKYTDRLKVLPLSKIFDDGAFAAATADRFGEISYDNDEYGFRNPGFDYDVKRGPRVVFVGSRSLGYGTGVPADKTFPAACARGLERLRPASGVEVVNANRGALSLSNTMHDLGEEMFTRIRPDVVVMGAYVASHAYPRHLGETLEERVFGLEVPEHSSTTTVRKHGMIIVTELPHSDLWYEVYSQSYAMGKFLSYVDLKMADVTGKSASRNTGGADNAGYIGDLHEYLARRGIPLVVVILPQEGGETNAFRTLVNDEIKDLCAANDIPLLDIDNMRSAGEYTFVADGHYSVHSNELIGGDIAAWLDRILDDDLKSVRGR